MAVTANTNETYNTTTIREDLSEALTSISPTEVPFMTAVGSKNVSNTYFEWPVVSLAAAASNVVAEGESAPGNDAPNNAVRLGNYCQLSDKVVEVSTTADSVTGAGGNVQSLAKQVALKLKELKRDMELACTGLNNAAVAGSSGTARETASLSAFLRTNVDRGATATAPTLSGTTAGYPNAAPGDGTDRALTELMLNDVIADCWTAGAEPSIILCGAGVKQKISKTFTGTSTRYQEMDSSKTITSAVDIYVSDFGTLQVVPSRFTRTRDLYIIDPSMARICYLQKAKQTPLARTGHAERRLIAVEFGLQVDTELAHGVVADIDPAL
jgi:hypothetical protein